MAENLLPHTLLNPNEATTILFIHGAFGNRDDWDAVAPHLWDYHILLVDLPGHGEAARRGPFSTEYAADLIKDLIEARAVGGAANIVGLSLGASVALCLASRYPHVVRTMLVSGYGHLPRKWFTPCIPYAVWSSTRIEYAVPRRVIRWLTDDTDLKRPQLSLVTADLARRIFVDTISPRAWPPSWPARTLVVAATKRGILPTDDNVEAAKKVAEIGRQSNAQTYAVFHPEMRHYWARQAPKLFADLVRAWIEAVELPGGFERLKLDDERLESNLCTDDVRQSSDGDCPKQGNCTG